MGAVPSAGSPGERNSFKSRREELVAALHRARDDAGKKRFTLRHLHEEIESRFGEAAISSSVASLQRLFAGAAENAEWQQYEQILLVLGKDPEPYRKIYFGEDEDATLQVQFYDSAQSFYSSLIVALGEAETRVRLTYIRQWPATRYLDSTMAPRYFDAVVDWANKTGGPVQRVIGVPTTDGRPDEEFLDWLKMEHDRVRSTKNYDVRVFDWRGRVDLRNIAVLDDYWTFETWSGEDSQFLKGHSIKSRQYAEGYIETFKNLFGRNQTVQEFLAAQQRYDT